MLQDITLGQFFPGTSFLHRMDPRVKIGLLFLLIVLVFLCNTAPTYGLLGAFTLFLMLRSHVPMRMMLKSLRPLVWIILFTFLIHLCSHPGELIAQMGPFEITKEGLQQGIFISLRLVFLILLSSLLTFTTSPLKLTDAMERILSPGKKIGLPAHELAMMMTIALRFVPTLIEETDKIMKAQAARGSDFASGNILQRLKGFVPVLVPLFLSAFRRADELAMAMEARCYHGGEGRTQMKSLKAGRLDYMACSSMAVLTGLLLYLRFSMQ